MREILTQQVRSQAGGKELMVYWAEALKKVNPQLPPNPAFPEAAVVAVEQLVRKLKPYNLVFGKPDDDGIYGKEVKNVSKAQATRDFLAENPTYKVFKVDDWYQ
ncbi:hypothetical protein [Hymenobacter sublimis]|uniref:Uncharacterized protein n=1 Tax=Hymenobacter sublimis TaxID=2933777 RepID=A0ABY4JFL1_9BACT|nr:hypothetical protein [Hymenobacter sublimis]UPL51390.1 hypothetical protein MWH26_19845 [Hymenobacter sublimis]